MVDPDTDDLKIIDENQHILTIQRGIKTSLTAVLSYKGTWTGIAD